MNKRFTAYAWGLVGYTLLVILWGVVVRATGSGAGCGSHWPTCNGDVLPSLARVETSIEFMHRLTSGAMGVLVIVLLLWAWRAYGRSHLVTRAAVVSLLLTVVEGAIGALLVRAELVADNTSVARAVVIGLHLLNTNLLLAALVATAWWAGGRPPLRLEGQPVRMQWLLGGGVFLMLLLGVSGAITALGDTLFPAASLAEGISQDLDPTAHFLVQLRVFHPALAILTGFYVVISARVAREWRARPETSQLAYGVSLLFFAQLAVGALNLGLLAPVWMQVIHLLMADLIWIVYILLIMAAFEAEPRGVVPSHSRESLQRVPSGIGD